MNAQPHTPRPLGAEPDGPLEQAVRRHVTGVWRYLRALGADPQEAEDLAQDAFVTAWQKGAGELEPAALGAFLRRTARFLFLRSRKAKGIQASRLVSCVDELWDERCAADDGDALVEAVRRCRDELQGRARSIVELTYDQGMSRRDAAAALSLSEDGVKSLLQRTREVLRDCVRRWQAWNG